MKERVAEIVTDKYIDLQTKLQMDNQFIDRNIDKLLINSNRQESHKQKKNSFRQKKCLIQQASFRQNDSWSERQLTNKKSNRIRLD